MPFSTSARKFGNTQTFGSIETPIFNQMFNLYSENNRILEVGDHCLFLLTNLCDYYAPVIMDGIVLFGSYISGQEKLLYINPQRIIDDERIAELSLYGKKFSLYKLINNQTNYTLNGHPKLVLLTKKEFDSLNSGNPERTFFNSSNYTYQCFSINCFFCRGYRTGDPEHFKEQLKNITEFRKEYIEFVRNDINNMLNAVDSILTIQESTNFQQRCTSLSV